MKRTGGRNASEWSADPWYVRTLAPSARRSEDARVRERMRQDRDAIDARIMRAVKEARISVDALTAVPQERTPGERVTMMLLAEQAANAAVKALADALEESGADPDARAGREEAWRSGAREVARIWLAEQAPARRWHALALAFAAIDASESVGTIKIAGLADVARTLPGFANALRSQAPWAAREACRVMQREALAEDASLWEIRIVQREARRLGRTEVSDEDARAALAHWRWPRVTPPLAMVAAGAGRLAPIQSDSAWANALAEEPKGRWERGDGWVATARTNEEHTGKEAAARVHAIAHGTFIGDAGERERALEEWRDSWRRSRALAGEGEIGTPRLTLIEPAYQHGMMWVFAIEGPDALLAASALEQEEIEKTAERCAQAHSVLALRVDHGVWGGHLRQCSEAPVPPARARALRALGKEMKAKAMSITRDC